MCLCIVGGGMLRGGDKICMVIYRFHARKVEQTFTLVIFWLVLHIYVLADYIFKPHLVA